MTDKGMPADVASADAYDYLVDAHGTIWKRGGNAWTYLTDDGWSIGWTDWDTRATLPVEYEPYLPLDGAAAHMLRRALVAGEKSGAET